MTERARPTVLVVEDEADSRQMIVESLEAEGFSAAQSPDAADALARLEASPTTRSSSTCGCPTATAWTCSTTRSPATRTCGAS